MKLQIPRAVWLQMQLYVHESLPNEVMGIGTIERRKDDFVVKEIFLLEQFVQVGYCESTTTAIGELMLDLMEHDSSTEELGFRWHSHGSGAVYFSGIDERDIDNWDGLYVVNLVTNAHGDAVARFDSFDCDALIRNFPLDVEIVGKEPAFLPRSTVKQCRKLFQQKVHQKPFRPFWDDKMFTNHERGKYNGLF